MVGWGGVETAGRWEGLGVGLGDGKRQKTVLEQQQN